MGHIILSTVMPTYRKDEIRSRVYGKPEEWEVDDVLFPLRCGIIDKMADFEEIAAKMQKRRPEFFPFKIARRLHADWEFRCVIKLRRRKEKSLSGTELDEWKAATGMLVVIYNVLKKYLWTPRPDIK